ncbi:MAG: alanine--tRNA ligase [Planctomycetota bacterium]|nr:MAG: alanine--tRNA ligase [Planctomycetota bacterium]
MPKPTTAQIRQTFIDYFVGRHAHRFVPSSPVIPHDDPTLLFANAGMNQFKPAFLGQVAPDSPLAGVARAVNTQKCIRAGGKHNDLEDVGKDTYHHTFFEMLGNWSFGDFFKEEIIEWAWDLLTNVYKLPGERLYATYFGGDEATGLKPDTEARDLWRRFLPAERVLPGNMKDNFWEMGDTGPCGPCSELHFDRIGGRDAAALVNADDPNVIEIWNLVFIQYDRQPGGALKNLPAQHVDTGMGLERLASIIQGVTSNYDTDLFTPIFAAIENITHDPRGYHGKLGKDDPDGHDMAYRVIADHVRTLTFAITDGAVPSNEGRGYVLRRVLRRAVRFGRQKLNAPPGFFSQLVPVVVEHMSVAFPELKKNPERVIEVIREEEESFGKTLEKGIKRFEEAAEGAQTVSGEDAFQLYDTYGFPLDLTVLMAEERGLTVDVDGFEKCMAEQKERSRGAQSSGPGETETLDPEALARLQRLNVKPTDDSNKFNARDLRATVKAIWSGHNFDEHATATSNVARRVGLIFDKTNHYAEMGGQVTDHGRALVSHERKVGGHNHGGEFKIEDVRAFGGYAVHFGRVVRGEIRVGDDVQLHIENQRRGQVAANHTATHLLNLGLRRVLGEGVEQKGSLVETDRLRFDFSHNKPVSPDELGLVEQIVAERIEQDLEVFADLAPLYVAKGIKGLRAVFGETYPDPVRVVSVGVPIQTLLDDPDNAEWAEYSVEFCGGTHVAKTGEAKAFAADQRDRHRQGHPPRRGPDRRPRHRRPRRGRRRRAASGRRGQARRVRAGRRGLGYRRRARPAGASGRPQGGSAGEAVRSAGPGEGGRQGRGPGQGRRGRDARQADRREQRRLERAGDRRRAGHRRRPGRAAGGDEDDPVLLPRQGHPAGQRRPRRGEAGRGPAGGRPAGAGQARPQGGRLDPRDRGRPRRQGRWPARAGPGRRAGDRQAGRGPADRPHGGHGRALELSRRARPRVGGRPVRPRRGRGAGAGRMTR